MSQRHRNFKSWVRSRGTTVTAAEQTVAEQLNDVLAAHSEWIKSGAAGTGVRLDLTDADLVGAILTRANLFRAPNWCHNELKVQGPYAELQRFAATVSTEEQSLSFLTIVPEPADLSDREGNELAYLDPSIPDTELNRYAWRLRKWGCKADAQFGGIPFPRDSGQAGPEVCRASMQLVTPAGLEFSFVTAWSPPVPFCRSASERFPELKFVLVFVEPGIGFAGSTTIVEGQIVEDEELNVDEVLVLLKPFDWPLLVPVRNR